MPGVGHDSRPVARGLSAAHALLAAAVWSPYWVVNAVEIQKFGGARVFILAIETCRSRTPIERVIENLDMMRDAYAIAERLLKEPHVAWMGTGIELLGSHAFIRFEGTGRTDLERRRQGER